MMNPVLDYRQALVEAMTALAKVHCHGMSPWTEGKAWDLGDSVMLASDYLRWVAGVRDHRICDYAAVTALNFFELVMSVEGFK